MHHVGHLPRIKNGGLAPLSISGEGLHRRQLFKTPALDITVLLHLLDTTASVGGEELL